jgi:hypothetical protein
LGRISRRTVSPLTRSESNGLSAQAWLVGPRREHPSQRDERQTGQISSLLPKDLINDQDGKRGNSGSNLTRPGTKATNLSLQTLSLVSCFFPFFVDVVLFICVRNFVFIIAFDAA